MARARGAGLGKAYEHLHSLIMKYAINSPVFGKQSGHCHGQSSVSDMEFSLQREAAT